MVFYKSDVVTVRINITDKLKFTAVCIAVLYNDYVKELWTVLYIVSSSKRLLRIVHVTLFSVFIVPSPVKRDAFSIVYVQCMSTISCKHVLFVLTSVIFYACLLLGPTSNVL